jgi:hypothetical protein
MESPKALVQSWTFWFGALQIALAAVGYVSGLMDPQAAFALFVTGAGSIGLRIKTQAPISGILPDLDR